MSAVSISCDFLDAMMKVPGPIQRKVRQFVSKFMADPKSPGINYERIQQAQDKNLRSVRIDQAYRAIAFKSPNEDTHILLWVDSHDDAYSWACRRRLEINPRTGSLQILQVNELEADELPASSPIEEVKSSPLFCDLSENDLIDCGIPQAAISALQFVRESSDLERLRGLLPQESYEALSLLADGLPLDEVKSAFGPSEEDGSQISLDDFERAVSHPDSLRRFARISSSEELQEILDAPLEKWRVYLHPAQRKLTGRLYRGPAKLLGGPGTGKTVVAMHRAKHLAEASSSPERVLFTTFTANLAENLESIMRGFVSHEAGQRLDVIHLHKWLARFMRGLGIQFDIADKSETDGYWRQAIGSTGVTNWTSDFLQKELHDIVLVNGISTEDDYIVAPRRGAKGALKRSERPLVWQVLREFQKIMNLHGKRDWLMLTRDAREYLDANPDLRPYRHVVVDEAQDFHPEEWRLIRALAPAAENDIFIVGDSHQRIYGSKVVLSRCGIETRGRSSTLRLNYRTTHEIGAWATAMYEGRLMDDLDDGLQDLKGYSSLLNGAEPEVHLLESVEAERQMLLKVIRECERDGGLGRLCIASRTNLCLQDRVISVLEEEGVPYSVLQKEAKADPDRVAVATMHRVKGLEFPVVFLAGVEEGLVPLPIWGDAGEASSAHLDQERAILFVAATRAREKLVITGVGSKSSLL